MFCMIFTWQFSGTYFQLIFKLTSSKISWKYLKIVSSKDRGKQYFKDEWTLKRFLSVVRGVQKCLVRWGKVRWPFYQLHGVYRKFQVRSPMTLLIFCTLIEYVFALLNQPNQPNCRPLFSETSRVTKILTFLFSKESSFQESCRKVNK